MLAHVSIITKTEKVHNEALSYSINVTFTVKAYKCNRRNHNLMQHHTKKVVSSNDIIFHNRQYICSIVTVCVYGVSLSVCAQ